MGDSIELACHPLQHKNQLHQEAWQPLQSPKILYSRFASFLQINYIIPIYFISIEPDSILAIILPHYEREGPFLLLCIPIAG